MIMFMPRATSVPASRSRVSSAVLIDVTAAEAGRTGVARWIEGFCDYLEANAIEYETTSARQWAECSRGVLRYLLRFHAVRSFAYYSIRLPRLSLRYQRVAILDNIARLLFPLPASARPFYLIHDVIPLQMDARFVRQTAGRWAAATWAGSRWLYRWRIRNVLFAAGARFGYVSSATRDAAIALLGEPARRGSWIGPMVLVPGLEPKWAQSAVGAQTNGQPFVLALGTGDPKKGVDTLLRAWRDAGVSGRMRLVLLGDGWKRSGRARVEASIRALQLENVVHLGCVTDEALRCLYRNATAFVFPSWFEGLGLPPAEYSHYGSGDLLLRDIPALREFYGDVARFFSSEEELKVLLQRAAAPCSAPLMAPEQRLERLRERLDAANTFHRLYAAIMGECA